MHRRPSIRAQARSLAGVILLAGIALSALASDARVLRLPPDAARTYPALSEVGTGTLRWFGFHVYDARLWLGSTRPSADRPFALALRYARDFEGRKIAEASIEEIERLGFGTAQERARWLDEMQGLFPDVREGHELAGLNIPGRGVRFYLDGRTIGEVMDPEFARAFFAIWLDPRTKAPSLRVALLNGTEAAKR
jgi:Chalcone isomerase-like